MTVNAYNNILGTVISTHTPLAGRDGARKRQKAFERISTHTPLAGRDARKVDAYAADTISTHTPLAGRDNFQRNTM